jgi:hypothetical protein
MGSTTTNRQEQRTALAGVVAALAPALAGVLGLVVFAGWYLEPPVRIVGAVVGGVAAVVVALAARRRRDRATLGFAVSVMCFALSWLPLGSASFAVGSILALAAQALVIAFGVMVLRRSTGAARVAGWVVASAGAVWLVGGLAIWLGTLPGVSQEALTVLFTLPAAGQAVAFLTAALLFVGPLVRPVGDGARYLWSTAEVR